MGGHIGMKENKIAGATKVLLDIMYFVGMVVTLTLPVSFNGMEL